MESLLPVKTVVALGRLWVLDDDFETTLGESGLLLSAAAVVFVAVPDGVAVPEDLAKACLVVLCPLDLLHDHFLLLVKKKPGAVVADAAEDLADELNETAVENGSGQLNVAEVTGALLVSYRFGS